MTRYVSLAAQLLRRARDHELGAPHAREAATLVPVARRALAQRRRHLMFRKVAIGTVTLGAAAALVLAAGPWLRSGTPKGTLAVRPASHSFSILKAAPVDGSDGLGDAPPLTTGSVLGTGISLQAPPGAPVRIGSADGTVLTLEARGELSVVEQSSTRRFSLRHGAVRARVAHLQRGERFLISTEDAEVEVHGTVFRVSLAESDPACENGRRTRVSVTEGIVSVRAGGRETLVAAGDSWPTCARSPAAAVATGARAVAVADVPTTGHRRVKAPPAPALETPGLAIANDLFAAAVRAKRERRFDDALRLFSRLMDMAPDGPLAEGAAVQRMKLLGASDPESARHAAADYLARYPDGFARDDARRLAGNNP